MGKIYNDAPPEAIHVTITSASYDTNYSPYVEGEVGHAAWTLKADYAAKFDADIGDGGDWVEDADYGVLPNVKFILFENEGEPQFGGDELIAAGFGIAALPYGGVIACLPVAGFAELPFMCSLNIDGTEYKYEPEYITSPDAAGLLPGQTGTAILTLIELG